MFLDDHGDGPAPGRPPTPASSEAFAAPSTHEDTTASTARRAVPEHEGDIGAVEWDDVVAANGRLRLPGGKQELKFQMALAGTPVAVWADDRSIHITRDGHLLRSRPSRYAASDLVKLIEHGAHPAGPEPAPKALIDESGTGIVEVERTVSRDGMVGLGGKLLKLPLWLVGQEVTLRFDRDLLYVIAATGLVASMPAEVPTEKRACPAHTPPRRRPCLHPHRSRGPSGASRPEARSAWPDSGSRSDRPTRVATSRS